MDKSRYTILLQEMRGSILPNQFEIYIYFITQDIHVMYGIQDRGTLQIGPLLTW